MKKYTTADQVLVRKLNTSLILDCLRTSAPLSRAELSAITGLNRSTVSSVINGLLLDNLVREIGLQSHQRGRPGTLLELNPGGGCAIGVEIGSGFIRIILTDFVAQVLWRQRILSNPKDGQSAIIERTGDVIQKALGIGREQELPPLGIGVGVHSMIDIRQGKVVFAPTLRWRNVPLRQILTQRFDLPVFVENEANAAALGEYYFGTARDVQDLIYLSGEVGMGSGIIINGRLFRGSGGYASEIGHTTVDPNGELCACGKRGCWQTVAGPGAIIRLAKQALEQNEESQIRTLVDNDLSRIDVVTVVQAAQAKDPVAQTVLKEVGCQLGIGIANLVNTFNPELIVLGGSLRPASPFLLPVIEQMLHEHALEQLLEGMRVIPSAHYPDACTMGAIALVLDEILREPML